MKTHDPSHINPVVNPGFESGLSGWDSAGLLEPSAHSGSWALCHRAGRLETTQTLTGLAAGWHTLTVWARSSGESSCGTIELRSGDAHVRASIPIAGESWVRLVVSVEVGDQPCTIALCTEAEGEAWVSFDDVALTPGRATLSIRGADISSLRKSEDCGGRYFDEVGEPVDALMILRDRGLNYARLRVWVDSPDGYHGRAQLLDMAKRLHGLGLNLLVDFHYADSWADPGKQPKPGAWTDFDFEGLKAAVYQHTFDVCQGLAAQGTPPAMVQIGNEITNGMLWPDGRNDSSFDRLAALVKEGQRAVRESLADARIMLHLDNGGNNALYRGWFDHILAQGVSFDVIGASYYPYWHGTLAELQHNLDDIARRFDRDIVVVETAYAFTSADHDHYENVIRDQASPGYPFTPEGQARMLADVATIVRAVPNGRGLGLMWWDATWIAVAGNGWDPADPAAGNNWENQALFDFEGRALPALRVLGRS